MKVYLAGPLFNEGERGTLSAIAARLRAGGYEVFVPHEQFVEMEGLDEAKVFRTDLDGPSIALITQSGHQGRPVFQGAGEGDLPGGGQPPHGGDRRPASVRGPGPVPSLRGHQIGRAHV